MLEYELNTVTKETSLSDYDMIFIFRQSLV